MQNCLKALAPLLRAVILSAVPVGAKEGVKATIHTPVPASVEAGAQIHVMWTLTDEKNRRPFSACAVFIRLIGPTGKFNEAFAECGLSASQGNYDARPIVPVGGVTRIEIGIAGTMTDREGNSQRSDWLMPLTNNPISD